MPLPSSLARGARSSITLALVCSILLVAAFAAATGAAALPDGRGVELVSNISGDGGTNNLNGASPLFYDASNNGDAVDWQAFGACCGATSGGIDVYQSQREPAGWETRAISPAPPEPPVNILELQEATFASGDLAETIFTTPSSYAQGDQRPPGSGGSDLYLRRPDGELDWLSQGPAGTGREPYPTNFEGSTQDATAVAFTTAESLTANAAGRLSQPDAQYLYLRNVSQATTSLIDVDDSDRLISPYGASLGDYGAPKEGPFFSGYRGSTINAVSRDATKVFFDSPPDGIELPAGVEPHLYVRDLVNNTTTPIDDPSSHGSARYQGASANGALVFFTSNEGLDGASTENELYEYNTIAEPLGGVAPMSSIPLASGVGILGVTSVSTDGSHVYFVADHVLSAKSNALGLFAVPNQPNLYVRDTSTGETTYVTTLAPPDVTTCKPTCATLEPTGLILPHDIFRPAYSSPNGSVLVFNSSADLTNEDHTPSTTLTATVFPQEHTLHVANTAGFIVGRTIAIGAGEQEELDTIAAIDSSTEMTLSEYGPAVINGLVNEHPLGANVSAVNAEVYRYATADGSLRCLSCTPAGVTETHSASLGSVAGGSYAPPGHAAQMSEDGSQIFFQSPDPLLPGMVDAVTNKVFPPENLYEWEAGKVYLISSAAANGSEFDGTTPSGEDVFFNTRSQLTPEAVAGYEHIYDARVGGGALPQMPLADPCASEACRGPIVPLMAFPKPASESTSARTGMQANSMSPGIRVGKITAASRRRLARRGRLKLTVTATVPGRVLATATSALHGRATRIAQDGATISRAGTVTLTLTLTRVARLQLAQRGALAIHVVVSFVSRRAVRDVVFTLHVAAHELAATRHRAHHA